MNRLAAISMLVLAGCHGKPQTLVVPVTDPTPPDALWLQADIPGEPLANVMLGGTAANASAGHAEVIRVTVRGTDSDGGLKRVRIWMNTRRTTGGVSTGPGLAGLPAAEDVSSATVGGQAEATRYVSLDLGTDTLMRGANSLTIELHGEAVNFHGGAVTTSLLRINVSVVNLRLHIVALRDDDGMFAFDATPQDFARLVDRANRTFSKTGYRIVFSPAADWETFDRTVLNRQQASWFTIADSIAGAHPARIVGILRWGSEAGRTGNANAYPPPDASPRHPAISDRSQRFVMLENFLRDAVFTFLNLHGGSHLAHELGHYLGMYHTFPDWTDARGVVYEPLFAPGPPGSPPPNATQAQVDQKVVDFIATYGGTIGALDGDQIADTPPDPSPVLFRSHGQTECTNRTITVSGTTGGNAVSYTFDPDISNVMSYFGPCANGPDGFPLPQRFTAGQAARMKAVLTSDDWRNKLLAGQALRTGWFKTSDGDSITYTIEPFGSPSNEVGFRLCLAGSVTWAKRLTMPDGQGSSWDLNASGSNSCATNSLWATQVTNGQSLTFSKAKLLGVITSVLVKPLNDFLPLPGGSRVTFTWVKD